MDMVNDHHNRFRLIACPHVLSMEKDKLDVSRPVGGTITDLLQSIGWTRDGLSARVFLDGELVKNAAWEYTLPQSGQSVVIRAIPMGGGDNGKTVLRLVAMIAIIAGGLAVGALPLFAVGGALAGWGGLAGAAISIIGSLAINDLIPPPSPRALTERGV